MHDFNDMDFMNQTFNRGAFITSAENTMIASWGMVGVMWNKKVYIVPVRESRYTKVFLDKTKEFTVSVPKDGTMQDEIMFCGRKSGRDFDKWKECGLEKVKAKSVNSYVVGGCQKYFECKVISAVKMGDIPEDLLNACYPDKEDLHTFYIGEIVEEY